MDYSTGACLGTGEVGLLEYAGSVQREERSAIHMSEKSPLRGYGGKALRRDRTYGYSDFGIFDMSENLGHARDVLGGHYR